MIGGEPSVCPRCLVKRHAPPSLFAPTRPALETTALPVATIKASTNCSPVGPRPVSQLHSRSSLFDPSERPMAARSDEASPSVSADHSPEANLTRPGAPWAMTCTAWSPSRPRSADAICRAAGLASSSIIASTSWRRFKRTVDRSGTSGSTKRISDAAAVVRVLLVIASASGWA